ncbi:Uncharacterised protein [uncultured archaeon]|nr:Uncharacterised protein [uncultured archaeon]
MTENKICPVHKEALNRPACMTILSGKASCPVCGKAMCPKCHRHNVSLRSTRVTGQWSME